MATTEKKPVTILGGKFELIGVGKTSSLILNGNEVRWDYLNKDQAAELLAQGCPHIKLVKSAKGESNETVEEPFPESTKQ